VDVVLNFQPQLGYLYIGTDIKLKMEDSKMDDDLETTCKNAQKWTIERIEK